MKNVILGMVLLVGTQGVFAAGGSSKPAAAPEKVEKRAVENRAVERSNSEIRAQDDKVFNAIRQFYARTDVSSRPKTISRNLSFSNLKSVMEFKINGSSGRELLDTLTTLAANPSLRPTQIEAVEVSLHLMEMMLKPGPDSKRVEKFTARLINGIEKMTDVEIASYVGIARTMVTERGANASSTLKAALVKKYGSEELAEKKLKELEECV